MPARDKHLFLTFGAVFSWLVALGGASLAQTPSSWPSRPMTMIVAAAAGGPIDVFGRVLAERMGETLGQSVVIDNIGGSGGMVGGSRAAHAAPDGYTFILGTIATHTFAPLLYQKPLYDPASDFTPVGLIAEIPLVLIARNSLPVNNARDFASYGVDHPGQLNFGSAGAGSASHLGCVLFNQAAGIAATHVPYKGTGPAMVDLQGGRIDYLCDIILSVVPQIKSGAVKPLAILSSQRSTILPDLPTAIESGITGAQAYTWTALFLPKGAPDAVVARLHQAMVEAMDAPATRDKLLALGATMVAPDRRSPSALAQFVRSETAKWTGPIRASGAVGE